MSLPDSLDTGRRMLIIKQDVNVYAVGGVLTLAPAPAPAPTALPLPAPSSLPAPAPTALPLPAPSSLPAPAPTALPLPVPSSLPLPAPTGAPTEGCQEIEGGNPNPFTIDATRNGDCFEVIGDAYEVVEARPALNVVPCQSVRTPARR